MENRRILKNRCNRSSEVPNSRHTRLKSAFDAEQNKLKKIKMAMEKHAADIARTISDMFKFMLMAASTLPNMELDVDIMRLKVDDSGIIFEITYPDIRKCKDSDNCNCRNDKQDNYDDEEGLLYDGD